MTREQHNGRCGTYRACPRCRQKQDRSEVPVILFCIFVALIVTGILPAIVAIIAQAT